MGKRKKNGRLTKRKGNKNPRLRLEPTPSQPPKNQSTTGAKRNRRSKQRKANPGLWQDRLPPVGLGNFGIHQLWTIHGWGGVSLARPGQSRDGWNS